MNNGNVNRTDRSAYIRRILIAVGVAAAALIGVLLLWYAKEVFLLIFGGILAAVFLRSISNWLSQHSPLSDGWALAVVILVLAAVMAAAAWLLAPNVANQLDQLTQRLPQSLERLQQQVEQYSWGRRLMAQVPNTGSELMAYQGDVLSRATGVVSTTFSLVINLAIIIFIGFYLAVDPNLYKRGLLHLIPLEKRDHGREVIDEVGLTLQWWLIGRFVSMLVVGVATTAGLWALGIPLALVLGLVAALLTFIPYLGPILSVVPAALLALLQGPTMVLYVILLYGGIQLIESYFITPVIQQQAVTLPPVLTITTQVIMSILVGGLGLVLATPLAATIMVLVKMLYVKDVLGDTHQTLPSERHNNQKSSPSAMKERA